MSSPLRLVPPAQPQAVRPHLDAGDWAGPIRTLLVVLFVIEAFLAGINFAMVRHERAGPYLPTADVESKAPTGPLDLRHETMRMVRNELDLDREQNLATWFSTFQFAIIGFLALALAVLTAETGWTWVGLGFLYLSADELAQIHEWVGHVLWHSNFRLGFIMPPYPWLILFVPPFLLFGVWMTRFIHREMTGDRRLFRVLLGGMSCMAMAFPLELIGGKLEAISGRLVRVESTFEETFELVGATLILFVVTTMVAAHLERRRDAGSLPAAQRTARPERDTA